MKDCPPDAIRRTPNGEVFIRDNCIGCGNCERNCPYGVIHMAGPAPAQPSLFSWLLFGREAEAPDAHAAGAKKAPIAHAIRQQTLGCIGKKRTEQNQPDQRLQHTRHQGGGAARQLQEQAAGEGQGFLEHLRRGGTG